MKKGTLILFILGAMIISAASSCRSCLSVDVRVDSLQQAIVSPSVSKIRTVHLYIENSASVDGYISGGADFKNAVHSYISDIKNSGLAENIDLNFINSETIDMGSDITAFFKNLNTPSDFRKAGGLRSSTDIAVIINKVLDSAKTNDVSILVSDFIFSPGKKDASRYLGEQQIIIKDIFSQRLKDCSDLAVMFFKLDANFTGSYYNREDKQTKLKDQKRPFYMLVVGQKSALKQIRDNVPETKIKGSGLETFIIERGFSLAECSVRPGSPKITKKDNVLRFALNIKIPDNILLDKEYVEADDTLHYKLSDNGFTMSIKPQASQKFTHVMEFESPTPKNAELNVRLVKKYPEWIERFNDDDGMDINTALDKTYGLKNIVSGIFEAYTRESDSYMQLPKITISIKQ